MCCKWTIPLILKKNTIFYSWLEDANQLAHKQTINFIWRENSILGTMLEED